MSIFALALSVSIEFTNGSTTSGVANFTLAEQRLREAAAEACGGVDELGELSQVGFNILTAAETGDCGRFDLAALACHVDPPLSDVCGERITWFRCYPHVKATATFSCRS